MGKKEMSGLSSFAMNHTTGNHTGTNPIDNVLSSSFVTWCTRCVVDYVNLTVVDADVHTAASSAAAVAADHGDLTWTIIAAISMLVGLLFTFVGYECFYLTLGLVAFVTGTVFSFGLLCGASNSAILSVILGVVCGALITVLVLKLERVGAALCGAAGGAIGYMYLNALVLWRLYAAIPETHQSYTPVIIFVVLALLGAVLAVCFERHIIIAASALSGAYLVGWAADRLAFKSANHNLNPIVLISGGGCHEWECYALLAGIVVLAVIGIVVQERRTREDNHHDGEPGVLRRFSKPRRVSGYEVAELQYDPEAPAAVLLATNERRVSREMVV